jgi:hypothetical protein
LRRWTTVGQSAERHPTAQPRRWQAFFSRSASGNPIRASHRRDDSVPREEPHVLFVRIAFALKGPDTSAQGKATRVVRVSPSPWVAYQRGKKALKGRDNRCIGLCRPFRAWEPIATTTRGGATLCPGLICPCPFRAHHRSPQDPERWRDRPHQPRAASTPNEPDDRERERRKIRSKPATSGQRKTRQPASGAGVCPRTLVSIEKFSGNTPKNRIFLLFPGQLQNSLAVRPLAIAEILCTHEQLRGKLSANCQNPSLAGGGEVFYLWVQWHRLDLATFPLFVR